VVNLGHPDDGGNETTSALKWLQLGGDGIDTAYVYHNQKEVGEAFRRSGRARDSVFITTKIPCPPNPNSSQPVTPEMAVAAVEEDLRELGMDYAGDAKPPCGQTL
jgi:diketogulonate reductase-like aldo/keto reductase